jgi:hypothetical protein
MAVDVVEKPSPVDLVMLPYREVVCDDTLRELIQVVRPDLVDRPGEPLRIQLLLDRRHKLNKGLSKPVAYFRMSNVEQLLRIANTFLSLAMVKVLDEQGDLEPDHDVLKRMANSHWAMALPDVLTATETILRDLELHRAALEKETSS